MAGKTFDSLQDVFVAELNDMYSAEQQVIDSLPEMIEAASSPELKEKFRNHMQQTQGQIERLEKAFSILGIEPEDEVCEGMEGIISDGAKVLEAEGDPTAKDAAIVAAAQKVEHYEISGYGTLRALARILRQNEIAELVQTTLQEESQTDELLTDLAQRSINKKAA